MEGINIIKFACLSFTAHEYLVHSKPDFLKLHEADLKKKLGYESLNRSKKASADALIKKEQKKFVAKLKNWEDMLQKLSDSFMLDKTKSHIYDASIDLLHRVLEKFEVVDGEIVEDDFKEYYFNMIDQIKPKKRTEDEMTKLKFAFKNFLVTQRLI